MPVMRHPGTGSYSYRWLLYNEGPETRTPTMTILYDYPRSKLSHAFRGRGWGPVPGTKLYGTLTVARSRRVKKKK
jgi:hypothetical protein